MNCIEVSVSRVGRLTADATRVGGLSCAVRRVSDLIVHVGLVCSTDLGGYGIIWASDGRLITLEGGFLIGAPEPE